MAANRVDIFPQAITPDEVKPPPVIYMDMQALTQHFGDLGKDR